MFFLLVINLVITIHAKDNKFFDGIVFRFGGIDSNEHYYLGNERHNIISTSSLNRKKYGGNGLSFGPTQYIKFPISIEFKERLINNYSFRTPYTDILYKHKNEDIPPVDSIENKIQASLNRGNDTFFLSYNNTRKFIIKEFLKDKANLINFTETNPNWVLSADSLKTQISLGYMFGVFYPFNKSNRILKFGLGIGSGYLSLKTNFNLCKNYEVTISTNVGKCNGKLKFGVSKFEGIIFSVGGHLTFYEYISNEKKIRIFSIDGYNIYDKTLNIDNFNENIYAHFQVSGIDVFSYTLRF